MFSRHLKVRIVAIRKKEIAITMIVCTFQGLFLFLVTGFSSEQLFSTGSIDFLCHVIGIVDIPDPHYQREHPSCKDNEKYGAESNER